MRKALRDPIYDVEEGVPRLLELMRRLRDPEAGCPWDIEQTFSSIAPYTIEEAFEVADAIEREAWGELQGELGDLLLQVVYYTQMSAEAGRYDFESVVRAVTEKMIGRHPHIFGSESRDKSATQQILDWEVQKASERAAKGDNGALDGVALGLPALMRALKLQKRAGRVGFDWTDIEDVLAKLTEEAHELAEAKGTADPDAIEDEMGDFLFVAVNLARHLGVDPEAALRRANAKFTRRFAAIEAALAERGATPEMASLAQMDALWDAAKAAERAPERAAERAAEKTAKKGGRGKIAD